MSSSAAVLAPRKPWETDSRSTAAIIPASIQNLEGPSLPAPPLPDSTTLTSPPAGYNNNNMFTPYSNPTRYNTTPYYSSNTYGGYGGSTFSSYGNGYYGNSYGPGNYYNNYSNAGPGNFLTNSLETTTRPLLDSLSQLMHAAGSLASFVDSTVFAMWSSVTSIKFILSQLDNFKNNHLKRWILAVKQFLLKIRNLMRLNGGNMGTKKAIVVAVLLGVPLLIKAFYDAVASERLTGPVEDIQLSSISSNTEDVKPVFAKAMFSFKSPNPEMYLDFTPGEVILISAADEVTLKSTNPTWILGQLKDGRKGYLPSNYVKLIE